MSVPGTDASVENPTPLALVTRRPGRAALIPVVLGLGLVAVWVLLGPFVSSQARDWAAGVPVTVVVTGYEAGDRVVVRDVAGSQSWTVESAALRQLDRYELGSQVVSRLVGDCRCQLLLRRPPSIPAFVPLVGLAMVAVGLPKLWARRRWRRLGVLLSSAPREASVEPVWVNRGLGSARWGLLVGGTAVDGQVLVLDGTPMSWFPSERTALVHGPEPRSGLVAVVNGDRQVAVASARRSNRSGALGRLAPWSPQMAVATGLGSPAATSAPLTVGGDQRVHVSPEAPSQTLAEASPEQRRRSRLVLLLAYLVVLAVAWWIEPDLSTVPFIYLAWVLAMVALRALVTRKLAGSPPLGLWPDRDAARSAAAAARNRAMVVVPAVSPQAVR